MSSLEPLLRLWRALDDHLERVEPTPWGAVVTDARFPQIHDANYARVEPGHPGLTAAEVEVALRPALARVGRNQLHVVLFDPEVNTDMLAAWSAAGHRLSWDAAMVHRGPAPKDGGVEVEELADLEEAFWARARESLPFFGEGTPEELDAVARLEREVMTPNTGKRWFVVRDAERIVSMTSLTVLEGVGYLDHVATFPEARGRGYAGALVGRAIVESQAVAADDVWLLTEPDGPALPLYERLGFAEAGRIASFLGTF